VLTAITTLVAALVGAAAALTGGWLQAGRQAKAAQAAAREQAYGDMLVASIGLAGRMSALLGTLQSRSGLAEGLSVVLGIRPPADAQQLHDWLALDYRPLMDAWSRIWVSGTPEAVQKADVLLDACADITAAYDLGSSETFAGRVRRTVVGVTAQDTARLAELWNERLEALAAARKDLAEFVRRETGRPPANLFSHVPAAPEA
jgi:hypothetical protein